MQKTHICTTKRAERQPEKSGDTQGLNVLTPCDRLHGDWVILTDCETTQDLQMSAGLLGAERTRTVDFEQQYGVVFAFRL